MVALLKACLLLELCVFFYYVGRKETACRFEEALKGETMKPDIEFVQPEFDIFYKRKISLPLIYLKCWIIKLKLKPKKYKVRLMLGEKCVEELRYKIKPVFHIRRTENDTFARSRKAD